MHITGSGGLRHYIFTVNPEDKYSVKRNKSESLFYKCEKKTGVIMANIVSTNTFQYITMLTLLFFKTLFVMVYWALASVMSGELDFNTTFSDNKWNGI